MEKVRGNADFSKRFKVLRERLGISQGELGERLRVSPNYIYLIESGRKLIDTDTPLAALFEQLEAGFTALQSEDSQPESVAISSIVRETPFEGTPRGRIKARRKALGLSLEDLAKLTGYQKSAIRNVEEGNTGASEKLLRALAVHLDLPLEELMGGSDHPHLAGAAHTFGARPHVEVPAGMSARTIPLLSWAQAGTLQQWDDQYEHEGIVAFGVKDPKAVAITIRGDSMEPQYKEGTVAIIYPGYEAKSGDLVIARLADGSVMFKRLQIAGDSFTFVSLNPVYPPMTVDKSKVEKLVPVAMTQSPHML